MWEGPHAGAGEKCEEEGVAETECYKLIQPPFPNPLHPQGEHGRRVGSGGMKLSLERKRGGGKVVLILFLFVTIVLCH